MSWAPRRARGTPLFEISYERVVCSFFCNYRSIILLMYAPKVQLKFLIAGIRFPNFETGGKQKTGPLKRTHSGPALNIPTHLLRTLFYCIAENNGVSDLFHGFAPLLALALQNPVSLGFRNLQVALQN